MTLVRRLARPMLATIFITGGLDALRNPKPQVPAADDVAPPIAQQIPGLPAEDTEQLIKINAGVQIAAGTLLALGRFPRLSAFALAATLIPTTAAGHRFWEESDPEQKADQQMHFAKNVSLLGGLLLAAVDTEGRPGLAWRASHAADHLSRGSRRLGRTARREAKMASKGATLASKGAGKGVRHEGRLIGGTARREANMVTKAARAVLPG